MNTATQRPHSDTNASSVNPVQSVGKTDSTQSCRSRLGINWAFRLQLRPYIQTTLKPSARSACTIEQLTLLWMKRQADVLHSVAVPSILSRARNCSQQSAFSGVIPSISKLNKGRRRAGSVFRSTHYFRKNKLDFRMSLCQ